MPTMLRRASGCRQLHGRLADMQKPRLRLQLAVDRSGPSRHPCDRSLATRSVQSGGWFRSAAFLTANPVLRGQRKPYVDPSKPIPPAAWLGVISRFRRLERPRTTSNPGFGPLHTFRAIAERARILFFERPGLQDTNRDIPEFRAGRRPRREDC